MLLDKFLLTIILLSISLILNSFKYSELILSNLFFKFSEINIFCSFDCKVNCKDFERLTIESDL